MADFPTFEAELGYAVARGWTNLTMADVAILARYRDDAEAAAHAKEVRRSAAAWRHIRKQLVLRISDLTAASARVHAPKNVILAQAHEVNQSQALSEQEVNETVLRVLWDSLPDAPYEPGRRRHARR